MHEKTRLKIMDENFEAIALMNKRETKANGRREGPKGKWHLMIHRCFWAGKGEMAGGGGGSRGRGGGVSS